MTWTAPPVTRVDEPFVAGERDILEGFLDWYRGTLLMKCAGLTPEQLILRPVPPSSMSLIGLIRHMTGVERSWFRRRFAGEQVDPPYDSEERPDSAFDDANASDAQENYAAFLRELDLAREATAGHALTETFIRSGREMSLRWAYVHMIEEYARHCGHADLIRELIDGTTGQ